MVGCEGMMNGRFVLLRKLSLAHARLRDTVSIL